jgi:large subunit ribosomal protein L32
MAHPKHRISKHKKRIRRSHLALDLHTVNQCPRCGSPTKSHRVCDNCGHYGFAKGGQKSSEILPKEEF